jgi:hypothetical protein
MLQELISPLAQSFLNVTGNVTLGGNAYLDIVLLNGFDPAGQTFAIMDYSTLNGRFANGSSFWDDGYMWNITYGQHQVDITAGSDPVSTPEPGTFPLLGVGLLAVLLRSSLAGYARWGRSIPIDGDSGSVI